jgi:outer membrane protein OmpA-like peptidoglycan-associated protein
MRHSGPAFLAILLLAGCAAPDRTPQLTNIEGGVNQTFGGDVGALIYHGYEAAKDGEAADSARANLAGTPGWMATDVNLSQQASDLADQAAEHRRQAEAALNRILDPLRDRIAKLEAEQKAEAVPEVTAVLHFAVGSAALPAGEAAKLQAVAHYLARHPAARVTITGFADSTGDAKANMALSRARANTVYDALLAHGMPADVVVAVIGAGQVATGNAVPADRRVVIEVRNAG